MGKLFAKTFIPATLDECWDFFSSPENLSKITPPEMDFVITSFDGEKMHENQVIDYLVKPALGIKTKWRTLIKSVTHKKEFVDTQLIGPYKTWHHRHLFKEVPGGVEMIDVVHFKAPFGILGEIAEKLFVTKKVESIFEYRQTQIDKIFKA